MPSPHEELYREHASQDLNTLNRWLIVLLCGLVKQQGGVSRLAAKELDEVDKGWALDYVYDDEKREVTLSVRRGPFTETYVVGARVTNWARADNPHLERLKQPPRSAALSDEQLAEMEKQANLDATARSAERLGTTGWVPNTRLRASE